MSSLLESSEGVRENQFRNALSQLVQWHLNQTRESVLYAPLCSSEDPDQSTAALSGIVVRIDKILNGDRYPIENRADARYTMLTERLRQELKEHQYCVLPKFVTPEAISSAVTEVRRVQGRGFLNRSHRNCYLCRELSSNEVATHPKNIMFDASYTMIAADVLPEEFALKALYYWQPMIDFVADVTGAPSLYPSADPYQPVNILSSAGGDQSAWHFDSWNAFTMTLMLQSSDSGGDFELVPDIRSKDDPNTTELSRVLLGDRSRVVSVPREPGALVIFRGSTSLHRVTEVRGQTPRLMAVFVYESQPGVVGEPAVNATVYGPRTQRTG